MSDTATYGMDCYGTFYIEGENIAQRKIKLPEDNKRSIKNRFLNIFEDIKKYITVNNTSDQQYLTSCTELLPFEISIISPDAVVTKIPSFFQKMTSMGILMPDSENIFSYLLDHDQMIDFVLQACSEVFKRLGARAQLSLEFFIDPEFDDAFPILLLRQNQYEDDLLDVIKDIRNNYETKLSKLNGDFHITTDFQPPIR